MLTHERDLLVLLRASILCVNLFFFLCPRPCEKVLTVRN